MDDQTPVASDEGAAPTPTPGQRLASAADEILHDAHTMFDKAAGAAEGAFDRIEEGASTARERVGQSAENVVDELRGIGSRLAAALQAAASTPEAENLKGDIREGAQRLVNELQAVIKASPIGKMGRGSDAVADGAPAEGPAAEGVAAAPSVPPAQRVASTVRTEFANALRSLNRALDRLAGQLERPTEVVDASASSSSVPGAQGNDAPTA